MMLLSESQIRQRWSLLFAEECSILFIWFCSKYQGEQSHQFIKGFNHLFRPISRKCNQLPEAAIPCQYNTVHDSTKMTSPTLLLINPNGKSYTIWRKHRWVSYSTTWLGRKELCLLLILISQQHWGRVLNIALERFQKFGTNCTCTESAVNFRRCTVHTDISRVSRTYHR
jgi:hypothetical protein